MDMGEIMQAVANVGFPIVCCFVLFRQNDKLSATIEDLKITLIENTTILKGLVNKLDDEKGEK